MKLKDIFTPKLTEALFNEGDPETVYLYAKNKLKGRFIHGEHIIARDAQYSFYYARFLTQLYQRPYRFLPGEPMIAQSAEWAYYYAVDIIHGKWPEAEPVIAKEQKWAHLYAKNIIHGPWPEAGIQ